MQQAVNTLSQFSFWQIVLLVVAIVVVVKWVADIVSDFVSKKNKIVQQAVLKQQKAQSVEKRLDKEDHAIQQLAKNQEKMMKKIDDITDSIKMLTESDKEDIKSFLTREHHYFCYTLHYIDDYSLDCCQQRYSTYQKQGGNSYIHTLMEELRALPKQKPQN